MPNQESLNRQIFAVAWPAIATNITTPLLSLVDVAVTGHIGSAVYIGAIAVGGAMLNMLYWLFGFLRAGTSGITAQTIGADDVDESLRTLARSLGIAVGISILILAFSHPLGDWVLKFMDADDATQQLATHYYHAAILGAPGVLVTFALSGWFLGMQNSRPAMWMALTANILNIILSLIFVFAFHLSVTGIGAATAIAQWISALVGFGILAHMLRKLPHGKWQTNIFSAHAFRRLLSVNVNIMLRTLCLIAVTLWFTHAGAVEGPNILAANALLMQLFMLFSYFMDGFAYAGEAIGGKLYGQGDSVALRQLTRRLLRIGTILALSCAVLYFCAGDLFLSLLTDNADVLAVASDYRLWAVLIPLCGFASFLWDGIYIGLTRTGLMLLTMLAAMAVFYGVYFALEPSMHNHALWLAFVLYLLTRGLVQSLLFHRAIR